MNYGRSHHGAIFDGAKFLIIGGDVGSWGQNNDLVQTEVCSLEGITMTCIKQADNFLEAETNYPELFLVAQDFGQDTTRC